MQVAHVKQGSFVSGNWIETAYRTHAAPSRAGPTALPDVHHTHPSHHQGDVVREAYRLWYVLLPGIATRNILVKFCVHPAGLVVVVVKFFFMMITMSRL